MNEILKKLSQPFDPADIDFKVQTKSRDRTSGLVVAYADARTYIERLNEVMGFDWSDTYHVIDTRTITEPDGTEHPEFTVECSLTLKLPEGEVTRSDVGTGDTLKAAYSDAFKRASVKFGLGLYLYSLPKVWAKLNSDGTIASLEEVRAKMLGTAAAPAPTTPPAPQPAPQSVPPSSVPSTPAQHNAIRAMVRKIAKREGEQYSEEMVQEFISIALELHEPPALEALTKAQASQVIDWLQAELDGGNGNG